MDEFNNLNTIRNMQGGSKSKFSLKGIKDTFELRYKIINWFRSISFKLNNLKHIF